MKVCAKKSKGFTLVELLVVIAIIALLVALVFPAINLTLLRGRVAATSVEGRNIYQAITGRVVMDIYQSVSVAFPDGETFSTSTEYFDFLVTNQVLDVAYSFFAAPGVTPARTRQEFIDATGDETAAGARNAWCIVDDSERIPETAPLLFTTNLRGYDNLNQDIDVTDDDTFRGHPFQNRGFAFVTRGGASFSLVGDDLRDQERFDGLFMRDDPRTGEAINREILRP